MTIAPLCELNGLNGTPFTVASSDFWTDMQGPVHIDVHTPTAAPLFSPCNRTGRACARLPRVGVLVRVLVQ